MIRRHVQCLFGEVPRVFDVEDDRGRAVASSSLPPRPSEQSTRGLHLWVGWRLAKPGVPRALGLPPKGLACCESRGARHGRYGPSGLSLGRSPLRHRGSVPGELGRGLIWLQTAVAEVVGRRCRYGLIRYRSCARLETAVRGQGGAVRLLVVPIQDLGLLDQRERLQAAFLGFVIQELREPPVAIDGSVTNLLEAAADLDPVAAPVG